MMYLLAALATVATAENFKMEFNTGFYEDDKCTDVMDSCEEFTCKNVLDGLKAEGFEFVKEECEEMGCHVKLKATVKDKDGDMIVKCEKAAQATNTECDAVDSEVEPEGEFGSGSGSGSGHPLSYFHSKTTCAGEDKSSAAVLSIAASVVVGLLALF